MPSLPPRPTEGEMRSARMDMPFAQRPETYLGEARAMAVKDNFVVLAEAIEARPSVQPRSFLDVGCATGDLVAFLLRRFPGASATGIDLDPILIEHARAKCDAILSRFHLADALNYRGEPADVVCCFGVLGIFDEFEPLLANLLANATRPGTVFVFGLMNPDDIDVSVRYRDNGNDLDWMRGFNVFSRRRIADWLAGQCHEALFHDFRMRSDVAKRPRLPHRAHSVRLADGERRMVNGLCMLLPETLLEIRLS